MSTFKQDSRYRGATVTEVTQSDGTLRDYTVLKKMLAVPLTIEDYYVKIDQAHEKRPDLLSYLVYGTVDYGWAIMEINGIRSWLDLVEGTRLRIAPIEAIQQAVALSHDR